MAFSDSAETTNDPHEHRHSHQAGDQGQDYLREQVQLLSSNTQVYKDEDGWFLLVNNRCLHLQGDGRCGIYEQRPHICRDHTNDDCEFEGPAGADDFELFFPDYQSLLAYCRKRFKNWERYAKPGAPAAPAVRRRSTR